MKRILSLLSEFRYFVAFSRRHTRGVWCYAVLTAVFRAARLLCGLWLLPLSLRFLVGDSIAHDPLILVLPMSVWAVLHITANRLDRTLSQKRDVLRTRGSTLLVKTALTAPYSRVIRPDYIRLLHRAAHAMGRHINAPIPRLVNTISEGVSHVLVAAVLLIPLCLRFPVVAAVATVTALIGAVVHRLVTVYGHRHHEKEAIHDETLSYLSPIAESTDYAKDIRMFGLAEWLRDIRNSSMQALRALIRRRAAVFFVFNVVDAVLALLRGGIAYGILIGQTLSHELSAWECVFFILCVSSLTHAVSHLTTHVVGWPEQLDAVSLYRQFLTQNTAPSKAGHLPCKGTSHTLSLSHVTFRPADTQTPVLHDLTLTLNAGERLAIVGTDKRGKTALAKLMCGLLIPESGTVRLDGIDVSQFDTDAYHALFSTVLQSDLLPEMTVAENVSLQADEIDEARVWECLEKADAAGFVCALPQSLHTPLGTNSGVTLSGGQVQRLLLARALFKDGDFLILDEPVSALDPLAEHALYREYDRLTKGKSVVFISERLASTRFCDRILLLQNGTVTEEGTHDELMKNGGEYARLFELQSRYYREGRDPDASV